MRKHLLAFALLALGLFAPIAAQAQCVSAGGVNTVPTVGQNCLTESTINTYAATGVGIVPASSATDVACITGGAGKVVRVLSIRVSGAGTLVSLPVVVIKHATANSGGTAATSLALPVPYRVDPTDNAPVATTTAYTANPTINDSTPGIIDAAVVTLQPSTAVGGAPVQFTWLTHIYNEPPTLRGITQQVCVNLNGVSVTSGSLSISFLWTENTI